MPLPSAFSAFFNVLADALFPVHPMEREVLGMEQSDLFKDLPRAPRAPIPEACSIFSYKDERVSRLVWSIKYKKSLKGASLAAHALYRTLRSFRSAVPVNMSLVLVPMPITKARRRERGFNQCALILDEIKALDADKRLIFACDLLVRARHTSRQTLKDRQERLASIQDIFAVNEKALASLARQAPSNENQHALENYFIVVIDDVITTGSTMKDAVHMLRRAGFKNAYGLSLAH